MPSNDYRLYAVRYASREATTSEVFYQSDDESALGLDYYFWVAANKARAVVIDVGFSEAAAASRGRSFLRKPKDALAEIGVDPGQVEHVILTHLHYDHAGNHALFPRATFFVQEAELAFAAGRNASVPAFRSKTEPGELAELIRLNYEGRVQILDGDCEIVPGIRVHKVGGHTAGLQIVSVETGRGRAIVASDAAHYYQNLEQGIPHRTIHDINGVYDGFQRIRELASSPDLIIPGHDPQVLTRLRGVGDGIAEV